MKKIVWLLIVCFLLSGCNISIKSSKEAEEKNDKVTDKVKEEDYTLSNEEEAELDQILNILDFYEEDFSFNKLKDSQKVKILYKIARDLNYDDVNHRYYYDNPEAYLNKANFEMIARDYFGPDAKFNLVDIPCEGCNSVDYYYDKSSESYRYNENHLGHGLSFPFIYHGHVKTVKKGDIVSISYKLVVSNYVDIGLPYSFFKSVKDSVFEKNVVVDDITPYCWGDEFGFDCDYEKMIEENEFDTYQLNFKKDGNKFYFIGYNKK